MKKILIILGSIFVIGCLSWLGLSYWIGGSVGGGGMQQYAPDTVEAGEPADITLIATATGGGGSIQGRFTNLSLSYRLVGENVYKSIQPQSIALPDNFKTVQSKTFQSEAYKFTIPAYPKDTTGEIEYYTEMTFDGYPSKTDGVKKIKIVNSVLQSGVSPISPEVRNTGLMGHATFLEKVRAKYPDVFSETTSFSFEWRWRDSTKGINVQPVITKIQGKAISTAEFSFQDLIHGEQSLLFQIEKTLPVFFEQEGFIRAVENDADHPTNGSSVQGYKRVKDGIVCLRIIEDTESEFINYQIACGSL